MPKKIPTKCMNCAKLSTTEAKEQYNCWDVSVCYSRRSHINNKERRNQTRNIKRQKELCEEINIPVENIIYTAILIVYRKPGNNTLIYALEVEVWKESKKHSVIKPILTAAFKKHQLEKYIESILNELNNRYGIKKFSLLKTLDISVCPIQ